MKVEPIWGFELSKVIRDVWLSLCPTVERGSELNLLKLEPELGELCWSVKLKANLNTLKEVFQLNIDKVLTCSFKYFKLKQAVLLSWAPGWPRFILSLGLWMRIWAVRWAGWAMQAIKPLSLYLSSPDWYTTHPDVHTYLWAHFQKPEQLPCWKVLFPTEFFECMESSFSQRSL